VASRAGLHWRVGALDAIEHELQERWLGQQRALSTHAGHLRVQQCLPADVSHLPVGLCVGFSLLVHHNEFVLSRLHAALLRLYCLPCSAGGRARWALLARSTQFGQSAQHLKRHFWNVSVGPLRVQHAICVAQIAYRRMCRTCPSGCALASLYVYITANSCCLGCTQCRFASIACLAPLEVEKGGPS